MIDVSLIQLCAPRVAVETVERIIQVESAGERYAINVNGVGRVHSDSPRQAIANAQYLIDEGYSVDLGLMQINSAHLPELNLSVSQIFEPCTNLKVGAQILEAAYRDAAAFFGPGQKALQAALSTYNTGDPLKGFTNGYVASIYAVRLVVAPPSTPQPTRKTLAATVVARHIPHAP
jgi:type IV secretion system protein VirB1